MRFDSERHHVGAIPIDLLLMWKNDDDCLRGLLTERHRGQRPGGSPGSVDRRVTPLLQKRNDLVHSRLSHQTRH